MSTFIQEFLETQQSKGRSSATLRATRSDLSHFTTWWQQTYQRPFTLSGLVSRDIRAWQHHRQLVDGVAPKTINRNLSTLRRFCQWGVEQGYLPDNPTAGIADIPQDDLAPRSLRSGAIDALLRASRSIQDVRLRLRDQALLALLVYAGLRSQEACDLQLRDLDLDGRQITVRHGKGGKARRVPIHSEARMLFKAYLENVRCPEGVPEIGSDAEREPFLLGVRVAHAGRPMKAGIRTRLVRKRIKQLGQVAAKELQAVVERTSNLQQKNELAQWVQQLRQLSPHQLRHSLARRLLESGATLPDVQRILGHSRLSTTGMYLLPSEDDLQQAIEQAGV